MQQGKLFAKLSCCGSLLRGSLFLMFAQGRPGFMNDSSFRNPKKIIYLARIDCRYNSGNTPLNRSCKVHGNSQENIQNQQVITAFTHLEKT